MSGFPIIITRQFTQFKFKESIPKNLRSHIVYKFLCSWCKTTCYGQNEKHFFVRSSKHLGPRSLTGKCIKNFEKSAINDNILIKGYDANYDDFSIFFKWEQCFQITLQGTTFAQELNNNIWGYSLELFDWSLICYILFYSYFINY